MKLSESQHEVPAHTTPLMVILLQPTSQQIFVVAYALQQAKHVNSNASPTIAIDSRMFALLDRLTSHDAPLAAANSRTALCYSIAQHCYDASTY
eukprot:16346-Heterococcus_DN1.PRE.1